MLASGDTRYDMILDAILTCARNSKADISQLNLPHGIVKTEKLKNKKTDILRSNHRQGRRHGFKSGGKRDYFLYPPPHLAKWGYNSLHVGGTSKQTTISIKYTEICCLVVALIHIS